MSSDPNSMVGSTYKLSVCLVCRYLCVFVFVFVSYAPGPARTSARVCSEAECNGWERARLQLTARTASTRIREQHPRSVNSWWEHKRVRVKWGLVVGIVGDWGRM